MFESRARVAESWAAGDEGIEEGPMCPAVDTYPVQWLVWPADATAWAIVIGSLALYVELLVAFYRPFPRLPGGGRRWAIAALVICGGLCLSITFYVATAVQDYWDRAAAAYFSLDAPEMSTYLRVHGDGCLHQIVLAMQQSQQEGEGLIAIAVLSLGGLGFALIGVAMPLVKRGARTPALGGAG